MNASRLRPPVALLLAGAALLLTACGGGGHGEVYYEEVVTVLPVVPLGDVEVDNQTDLTGSFEDMYYFDMAPALTDLWTGQLLPDVVFPGEIIYVASVEEDLYDAVAELDLGFVDFFDIFVEGGWTTTFEVY